jgi:hypothetical protein
VSRPRGWHDACHAAGRAFGHAVARDAGRAAGRAFGHVADHAAGRAAARDAACGDAALTIDPAIACLIVTCTALLFAAAAIHKLRDLRRFGEIFAAYGLLPIAVGRHSFRAVPLLEAAVAAGLLYDGSRTPAACVGIVLLLGYAEAIAVNLRRGRRDLACGCGGPDDRRAIAGWMVWRNIGIAILLATTLLPWSPRPLVLTDAVTIGFGTATCALVYLCLDRLLGRNGRLTDELRTN